MTRTSLLRIPCGRSTVLGVPDTAYSVNRARNQTQRDDLVRKELANHLQLVVDDPQGCLSVNPNGAVRKVLDALERIQGIFSCPQEI